MVDGAAAAAAADGGIEGGSVTSQDALNKAVQRQLQSYARKLQKKNLPKKEFKKLMRKRKADVRRQEYEKMRANGVAANSPGHKRPRRMTEKSKAAEHREALGSKHDVILIPIFWKQRG